MFIFHGHGLWKLKNHCLICTLKYSPNMTSHLEEKKKKRLKKYIHKSWWKVLNSTHFPKSMFWYLIIEMLILGSELGGKPFSTLPCIQKWILFCHEDKQNCSSWKKLKQFAKRWLIWTRQSEGWGVEILRENKNSGVGQETRKSGINWITPDH